MPRYYTGPYWKEDQTAWRAKDEADVFEISTEIRDVARRVTGDPARYRASQHLGHSCLAVVREAHPYVDNRSEASLRDVLGVAFGPGGSVYIEKHRTWKGTRDNRKADTFADNKGGCSQFVREPLGKVHELYLSDHPKDDATDLVLPDGPLGVLKPYIGMRSMLDQILDATVDPDAVNRDPRAVFFAGPEAVEMTGELMGVGHQFSHPALQEWYAERMASAGQAA